MFLRSLHLPQSLTARAELEGLMHTNKLLITPASNKNSMGIVSYLETIIRNKSYTLFCFTQVQDSLLGSYLMTARDFFIERHDLFDAIFEVLGDDFDGNIPVPCILKPKALWSGKQLMSMILPDISMNAFEPVDMDDNTVCIRRGTVLTGRFNKKILGRVERGLIHRMAHQEGTERTAKFMSQVQWLANKMLMKVGFSTGIEDCCVQDHVHKKVKREIDDVVQKCNDVFMKEKDAARIMNRARDVIAKNVIDNLPAKHGMAAMIAAGSKGSNINIAQIAVAVGQQNVNGKRIPLNRFNRTSSHYPCGDPNPVGRGFVKNSYLSGLGPKEFFAHMQGGRHVFILKCLLTITNTNCMFHTGRD